MSPITRLVVAIIGVILVAAIGALLVRRKINERNSMLWLGGALLILILSLAPNTLIIIAELVGVDYPPTLLFLFVSIAVLLIILQQSIQISKLQERLNELTQQMAIQYIHKQIPEKSEGGSDAKN